MSSAQMGRTKTVVYNPWTLSKLGEISYAQPNEIESAISQAWLRWQWPVPLEERQASLAQIATKVEANAESLSQSLVDEIGKPVKYALAEVARTAHTFRLASQQGQELAETTVDVNYDSRGADFDVSYRRFPIGPVLGFVPYNWPFNLAAHKIAPALLCGCPIVLKLSPLAPLSTRLLIELIQQCGVPSGSVCGLHLTNEDAQEVLKDERIKMLSFTGSPAVGWELKSQVPRKRCLLELGGNAPVVISESADLDRGAATTLASGYGYAGQVCISAQNVFVHVSNYDRLKESLAVGTERCPTGDPASEQTVCGPMINQHAAERVRDSISRAVAHGAVLASQASTSMHQNLVPPTLLERVGEDEPAFSKEVFGPVLTLSAYEMDEEMVARLNGMECRLQASVHTSESSQANYYCENLDYGGVVVNDSPSVRFDAMPYGGQGGAGFGREGADWAIDEMTALRAFVKRKSSR